MNIQILINNSIDPDSKYIGWAPMPSTIRLTDPPTGVGSIRVILRNKNSGSGGQLVFLRTRDGIPQEELEISLNNDSSPVVFFLAGRFPVASKADQDAIIEVTDATTGSVLHNLPLMVRIRKNANSLEPEERDRFLNAFGTLNATGAFQNFRDMHKENIALSQAHGLAGFLPWHRAYLLDLERELQKIDSSVSLPYWRFDVESPRLFTEDFMGRSNPNGRVVFSNSHPFNSWSTDGQVGINRSPFFNTTGNPTLRNESNTIALGDTYERFMIMEVNPHGQAHISFAGNISDPATAPKDPLFFLLHNNVDRLWAKWQWLKKRFDITSTSTYPFLGAAGSPASIRVGHNLLDTMWPWNQITGGSRPNTAPGGRLATRQSVSAPGLTPTVGDMIDYQGIHNENHLQGFDYDDVPFKDLEFLVS